MNDNEYKFVPEYGSEGKLLFAKEAIETGVVLEGAKGWRTLIEVCFWSKDGETTETGPIGHQSIHAMRDGRCIRVPMSVFMPWVAGLIGLEIQGVVVDDAPMVESVMNFDAPVDYGLQARVYCSSNGDWTKANVDADRSINMSADELWDALVELDARPNH